MVVTHPLTGEQLSIGVEVVNVPQLRETLQVFQFHEFDFIVAPLAHPRYERVYGSNRDGKVTSNTDSAQHGMIDRDVAFTRSDMELSAGEWMTCVIGKISPWIRLDAKDPTARMFSEQAFMEEVAFASFLSLRALIVPVPAAAFLINDLSAAAAAVANLARCVQAALLNHPGIQLWLRIPLRSPESPACNTALAKNTPEGSFTDSWEVWNTVRSICDGNPALGIALEVGEALPGANALRRWCGEPVKLVLLSTSAFQQNRRDYPVLARAHQNFVAQMFPYRPHFALCHRLPTKKLEAVPIGKAYRQYVDYVAHFFGKQLPPSDAKRFEIPFHDFLMAPLQPLADHLESHTYETFEQDPAKYAQYTTALHRCFEDMKRVKSRPLVVFVLGAGRGPLIRAAINAAERAAIELEIYAIEKNPNAVVTLNSILEDEASGWKRVVRVVSADMRDWKAPKLADVVVSELLGSFGDNELSPECLSTAMRFLRSDGVSIPCAYTSYLAPLSSSTLHASIKSYGDTVAAYETPYVVCIHRGCLISSAEPCFSWTHSADDDYPDPNSSPDVLAALSIRYASMKFASPDFSNTGSEGVAHMLHGFAGYFEATLYKDVMLSIHPETHTLDMFSWFPMYFPLRVPIRVPIGAELRVEMWRQSDGHRVWYEWALTMPQTSQLHNPAGRSYAMLL
mmetsp:Transcript_8642/g.15621  ORF Transcript_8642/g.15621 Transcript_8642/m.15621 type:complete len:680 (-) Transcript_8642:2030-4069(-)